MLKIRALNQEGSSDEDAPGVRREAQEEIALEMYNKALKLLTNGSLVESQGVLQRLLDENIQQLENNGGLPKTMSTFKYSCHINIGRISFERCELKDAIEHYISASELDGTDVTLWFKIGKIAIKLDRFRQAAYAFSKGLDCSASHWPCLDSLITLLYAIQDTVGCLYYIGRALLLDSYYIKGLVLRKKIYESNPATKEYFEKLIPDYSLEPFSDITVNEEDEGKCMEEVQKLCDHVNVVEKSLESKALPKIPLPTPLEDFTWLAVGQTLLDLHTYISDNNMSHFCKIDLNKCMSQKMDIIEDQEFDVEVPVEEVPEVNQPMENAEIKVVEEMETESVILRRMSQASENNNQDQNDNVTPVQTDENDEAELDTEDPEENLENKLDKNKTNRGAKRRRDLLSDLQIWGWHSKRKQTRKGRQEKDLTVEDALTRIIPSHLLRCSLTEKKANCNEDSMNTMDLYNLYVTEKQQLKSLSPIHSPRSHQNDNYFGSNQEKDDVMQFWTQKWACCDVVDMIEQYMFTLAKLWHFNWPKPLTKVYVKLYHMFREHCDFPSLDTENFEHLRNDSLATLLFGELSYLTAKCEVQKDFYFTATLTYLQQVTVLKDDWGKEFIMFFIRVHWLRANFFQKEDNNLMSIQALQLIQELILDEEGWSQEKYILTLPNCNKHNLIATEIIEKLLGHLEMIDDLSQLENLYNQQEYKKVAEILKPTFTTGSHPTSGRMIRPAQIGMLLHALWFTDITDCFVWTEECLFEALGHFLEPLQYANKWELVTKKCLDFLLEIIKTETVCILDSLSEEKRSRLVESLSRIVCHQLNSESGITIPLGCITPWIVLFYVLSREEHRMHAKGKHKHVKSKPESDKSNGHPDKDLPPSIAALFSAHQFLGPKGWCVTNQGELLHFMLDNILDRLDTPIFETLREKIDIHIEQALFCLYQHPSKKNKVSRHLADHNVNPLPLSWERAHQLYEFYCPDRLPEFDSYKSISISADLEQLLQRISALVPQDCDPQPVLPKITDYIQGITEIIPEPIQFPNKVRAMYYLLGDYYFKQNEVGRSLKYFMLDLCINPLRLDTWACIALGTASQLEGKLNHCQKFKNENEFLDKAKGAKVCFKQALKLANDHVTLWIEYGSFEYMVHSFCSRLLKHDSDTMSMEKFEILENVKDNYVNSSYNSFQYALSLYQADQTEADERWLYHYMLGKIEEKQRKDPVEYLQHYLNAAALLEENNATYPDKISYTNPQHLSLEALEVHYRIHASILKYLELHEGKPILSSLGKVFKKCLNTSSLPKKNYNRAQKVEEVKMEAKIKEDKIEADVRECIESMLVKLELESSVDLLPKIEEKPLETEESKPIVNIQEIMDALMKETMSKQPEVMDDSDDMSNVASENKKTEMADAEQNIRKSTESSSSSTSSSASSSSSSESDSDDSSSSSSTSSDVSGNLSEAEVMHLVDRCITGLEQCIIRLPQNYKALYRLVHLYFNYKGKKDLAKCRQLFLGDYKCKSSVIVSGLFSDRKTNNFFNGVWRIPSSEIDRPGSFAAHMGRCVSLLLQVLRNNNDYKTLFDVCLQLRRNPDLDKIYIRDVERKQLAEQALSLCIQALRTLIKNVNTNSRTSMSKLLLDIYRVYQKVQKHIEQKEGAFASMLTEVYTKMLQDKVPENVNILDLALKYCQQNRPVDKPKLNVSVHRGASLTPNAPVLPAPSSVSPHVNNPLKKSSSGRPRGRPPGPKLSTQMRYPRGRSPNIGSNAFWQSQLYNKSAYDYMKHYQEALIRQYSKSLDLNQLARLGQYFNQGSFGGQYGMGTPSTSQGLGFGTSTSQSVGTSQLKKKSTEAPVCIYPGSSQITPNPHSTNLTHLPKPSTTVSSAPSKLPIHTTSFGSFSSHLVPANMKSTSKSVFTMPSTSNTNLVSGYRYPPADMVSSQKGLSKTPSYHQAFLEAMSSLVEKQKLSEKKKKSAPERPKTTLPNRPNISITPVMSNPIPPLTTSPGKTLQEKLAEKQKQLSTQHLQSEIRREQEKLTQGIVGNVVLPNSLTISRTPNVPGYPKDSGMSLSEATARVPLESPKAIRRDPIIKNQPSVSSPFSSKLMLPTSTPKAPSEFELPPNIPLSLSVIKKPEEKLPERKMSSDDDVIIIE